MQPYHSTSELNSVGSVKYIIGDWLLIDTLQGMGEPLSNYEAVKAAVSMMADSRLFGISKRHITVSTVGVIPRIKQMATDMQVS